MFHRFVNFQRIERREKLLTKWTIVPGTGLMFSLNMFKEPCFVFGYPATRKAIPTLFILHHARKNPFLCPYNQEYKFIKTTVFWSILSTFFADYINFFLAKISKYHFLLFFKNQGGTYKTLRQIYRFFRSGDISMISWFVSFQGIERRAKLITNWTIVPITGHMFSFNMYKEPCFVFGYPATREAIPTLLILHHAR